MREEFIYCPPENSTDILGIDLAGTSFCDGSYGITRQKSNVYVMEYVLSGTGTIFHNGQKYTASAGEMYLLHQGAQHRYYSSKEDPWVKLWINLKGTLIEHLLEVYPLEHIVYAGDKEILDCFRAFHRELASGGSPLAIQQSCALLLHKIISSAYFHSLSLPKREPDDAQKIKKYLDQHILDEVNLEDLCDYIYKSKAQVIRQFKKAYGMTPYAYLLDSKLQYAKKLLLHTNIPIKEIAARLSFADEHYFSTYFKQAEKVSPSVYRQSRQDASL